MERKISLHVLPWEAFVWLGGLLYLAVSVPSGAWSICPLHNLGIDFCPGCGLGRSVSHILHGEWNAAWQLHPLGFVALPLLIYRSISLIILSINNNNNYHG